MKEVVDIKWVIAHDPLYLFIRAAGYFQEAVNKKSDKYEVRVEIMTPTEYATKYNNGAVALAGNDAARVDELSKLMDEGRIQMSQMVTTNLAAIYNKDMHVLDMPFLFRDHDHATEVLEGETGQQLLAGLAKNGPMRGLGFTYSGGFRCLPSSKNARSLADLAGETVRAGMNPMARDTFAAVGINPLSMELYETNQAVEDGKIVAGESAFPRIYPCAQNEFAKTVIDSGHSLFLTSIVVNEKWWNTLDAELQQIISEAAVEAARMERERSIEDGEDTKLRLASEGVEVVSLSAEEREYFKQACEKVYQKYEDFFTPGLVDSIRLH